MLDEQRQKMGIRSEGDQDWKLRGASVLDAALSRHENDRISSLKTHLLRNKFVQVQTYHKINIPWRQTLT